MKTVTILLIVSFLGLAGSRQEARWYSIKFQSLCIELERNVTPERGVKHGKLSAYRIRQDTIAMDTIRVSFDFISNCCEEFESKAEIANDTLMLSYYKTSAETCRCLCDYRFTYSVTDTTKRWGGLKILHLKKK
jgi:hypothetical protein